MLTSDTRAWVEIDVKRIAHNVEEVRNLLPSTNKIMAIVKANAYGHGDVICSKALEACGIDFFGVSSIDEAINLRNGGIKSTILVLGYTPPVHFGLLAKYQITQTLLSLTYAQKLDQYCEAHKLRIQGHVKVDTGMSRLGVITQEHEYHIEEVISIYQLPHLDVCGIFSHFSVSDDLKEEPMAFTTQQIVLFQKVLADIQAKGINPGIRHLQNSYGILNYPELDFDYARPGLLWMGVTSDDAIAIKTAPKFLPVLSWKANVSLVKTIAPNVSVSYGRNYHSHQQRVIATVAVGYADGFPRCVSNTGYQVLIHGQFAPIVGNICMDQMMIDVSDIPEVKEGDVVTLIGEDQGNTLSVDTLSRAAHTINNETLCWISARVPRIYK